MSGGVIILACSVLLDDIFTLIFRVVIAFAALAAADYVTSRKGPATKAMVRIQR